MVAAELGVDTLEGGVTVGLGLLDTVDLKEGDGQCSDLSPAFVVVVVLIPRTNMLNAGYWSISSLIEYPLLPYPFSEPQICRRYRPLSNIAVFVLWRFVWHSWNK